MAEAEAAIERLAAAPADEGLVMRDIWLLRLRALLAKVHGDESAYRDYRDRYRDMARIAWLRRTYRVGRGDDMTGGQCPVARFTKAQAVSELKIRDRRPARPWH